MSCNSSYALFKEPRSTYGEVKNVPKETDSIQKGQQQKQIITSEQCNVIVKSYAERLKFEWLIHSIYVGSCILVSALKEEAAHASAHALAVVEHVEPVHQLVDSVAALCDRA